MTKDERIHELERQVAALSSERNALAAVASAAYTEGREHERREWEGSGPQRRQGHLQAVR